ncbi:hypothetical protein [Mycobacteroides abscessus]|uniref:hypothetical protein n=1 Tax=Mycobacteroides abscessus TaxID=36809 RepID=UPI0013001339|nr:hypothetical protein [Mycobacteroides abscessus]
MPAGKLRADTTEWRLHARKLEAVATELRQNQAEVHGDLPSIAQGFSGTAVAGALSALHEHWERETAVQHKDLMAASAHYEATANSIESQEDQNKRRFDSDGTH